MAIQKDIEILQLNLFESDKSMPPDVKNALVNAIAALYHILYDHGGVLPKPPAVPNPH